MRKKENEKNSFLVKSKRILATTLAMAMVASSYTWAGLNGIFANKITADTNTYKLGDVNNDGNIDIQDATITLKAALNIQQLTEAEAKAADLTGDGKVSLDDAVLSLKVALAIEELPEPTGDIFTVPPKGSNTPKPEATPKTTFAYL